MDFEQKKKEAEKAILKILQDLEKESKKDSIYIYSVNVIHCDDEGHEELIDAKINMEMWT